MQDTLKISISKYRLARNTGMELNSVGKALNLLIDSGLVTSFHFDDSTDLYHLEIPRSTEFDLEVCFETVMPKIILPE